MCSVQSYTQKQLEIARLQVQTLPKPNQHWQLHANASSNEVLVVHMWLRKEWDDKQTLLVESKSMQAAILFQGKLEEVNKRLEKSKEASLQETSELRLAVKDTEVMVENMKADFCRNLKDVNIRIGEITYAIGSLKKRQGTAEEDTKFLREAQADTKVQIYNMKKQVGDLQKVVMACQERCRCGSPSLLRKIDSKLDRDICKGDKVMVDLRRGGHIQELQVERPAVVGGKRGFYVSKKGRIIFCHLEDIFIQEKCNECRLPLKRQRRC